MTKHTIEFLPDNITVTVDKGENLLSAAAEAGVYIHAYCGGDGVCGKCKVVVDEGEVHSSKSNLKQEDWDKGFRLACLSTVESDLKVTIPEMTTKSGKALKRKPKTTRTISAKSLDTLIGTWEVDPPVSKIYLELDPPTMEDNISDMQRVMRGIKLVMPGDSREPSYDHPELIKHLPRVLRESDWKITLLLLRGKNKGETFRIIDVEAGNTTKRLYGLAVDIGTTTCSGVLVDLNTGKIIAEASGYNGQISFGEDVISRIIYAARPGGLKALQDKVIETINTIIDDICRKMIISPSDISYIMAAGNTVMSHLLLGLDPKYIRESPYVPSVSQFPLTKAAGLGIHAHPSMRLFLYPCIASYVGGDIVAGVHACQMAKSEEVSLFIDIGTNG
ncbi:MAG: ferredoxin, partial [Desulfobulbus sp.]